MALNVTVKMNDSQLASLSFELRYIRNGVERAISAASNRTAQTGATRIRRAIAKKLGLRVKSIGKMVRPIKRKAGEGPSFIRILDFNKSTSQAKTKKSITSRKQFAVTNVGDVKNVFGKPFQWGSDRKFKKGKPWFARRSKKRLKIDKLFIESPRDAFEMAGGVGSAEMVGLQAVFQKNLSSQVNRLLKRRK